MSHNCIVCGYRGDFVGLCVFCEHASKIDSEFCALAETIRACLAERKRCRLLAKTHPAYAQAVRSIAAMPNIRHSAIQRPKTLHHLTIHTPAGASRP